MAQALEWVEDIELIRTRSSFQGVISKNVRERLEMIKACFQTLHSLSLGANDAFQLKTRNARLAADYHAAQQEISDLKQEINRIKKDYRKERVALTSRSTKVTRCAGTCPIRGNEHNIEIEKIPTQISDEIVNIKNRIISLESSLKKNDVSEEFPELKPLPQRQPRIKPIIKSMEKINPERRIIIKT